MNMIFLKEKRKVNIYSYNFIITKRIILSLSLSGFKTITIRKTITSLPHTCCNYCQNFQQKNRYGDGCIFLGPHYRYTLLRHTRSHSVIHLMSLLWDDYKYLRHSDHSHHWRHTCYCRIHRSGRFSSGDGGKYFGCLILNLRLFHSLVLCFQCDRMCLGLNLLDLGGLNL